jgi:hypothetical protein
MFFQLIMGIAIVLISICLYIISREVWKRR